MKKDTKIFIAGAAGMVGSAIIRKLLSLGYTNLVGSYHSKRPGGSTFLLENVESDAMDGLRLVQIDLRQQTAVNQFFAEEKPAYVFLAAAKVGGIHANNSCPAHFIHDNLSIQTHIIHAAYQYGVDRLLFLGSSCIYPKLSPQPMKETHLLTGLLESTNEPYAVAKIAGIKMCEAYNRQYGTRFIAAMPTNLYGTNDNFDLESSHVLPALIRKFHLAKLAENGNWEAIEKDEARFGPIPEDLKQTLHSATTAQSSSLSPQQLSPQSSPPQSPPPQSSALSPQHSSVTVWGSGRPRREFLHVDDLADACAFVMNLDDGTLSEYFLNYPEPCFVNIGCGIDGSIQELAEIIMKEVGFEGKLVFDTSKPDGAPQKLLDVSRMAELGWRSSVGLSDGIKQTYQWYLDQIG